MAAEIESIAYVGEVPWHGIGVALKDNPTPPEMLKQAGLNWNVSRRPMFTASTPDFKTQPDSLDLLIEQYAALVRDSDNKIFGICGPRYQPFQNSETFEFFSKFTEAGKMKLEVAGSLKGGLWVWALARIAEGTFTLPGGDTNHSYLLMCSPFIWGEAMTVMFTSIRVVCWNTLTQALSKKLAEKFRYMHNKSFADVRPIAELSVEQALIHNQVYKEKVKILFETRVVDRKLYEYIAGVAQPILLPGPVNPVNFHKSADTILRNYHMSPGSALPGADHTWWGAFNAVTYFFDHQSGRSADTRLTNSWVSHGGAVKKRQAFESAVNFAMEKEVS